MKFSIYNSKIPLILLKKLYKREETNGFNFLVCVDGSVKSHACLERTIELAYDSRDRILVCHAPHLETEK